MVHQNPPTTASVSRAANRPQTVLRTRSMEISARTAATSKKRDAATRSCSKGLVCCETHIVCKGECGVVDHEVEGPQVHVDPQLSKHALHAARERKRQGPWNGAYDVKRCLTFADVHQGRVPAHVSNARWATLRTPVGATREAAAMQLSPLAPSSHTLVIIRALLVLMGPGSPDVPHGGLYL